MRRGLPLAEIQSLSRPEFDTPKTIGLASGIFMGMVTFVTIAIESPTGSLSYPAVVGGE